MRFSSVLGLLVLAVAGFWVPSTKADSFCFALAQTVYEQVYCELERKAQTKGLPSFNEFKKNNEQVQASLLKRPAERNGIKLPLPKKNIDQTPVKLIAQPLPAPAPAPAQKNVLPVVSSLKPATSVEPAVSAIVNTIQASGCTLGKNQIQCAEQLYLLQGNKNNRHLAAGVLSDENKMAIPALEQGQSVSEYLSKAYEQYIDKMCAIGLAGVTMTYGKFSFLYRDVQTKGLDFAQRFELMYSFLKKDKASMGISESVQLPSALTMDDCQMLNPARFICALQGRNYIFDRQ